MHTNPIKEGLNPVEGIKKLLKTRLLGGMWETFYRLNTIMYVGVCACQSLSQYVFRVG